MDTSDSKEVVNILSKFVNNFCCDQKGFVKNVMREHRTIQQNIFRVFALTIKEWAKKEEFEYDLRNEATVQMCKEISKAVNLDAIPFI